MTNAVKIVNATHSTISGSASRQFRNSEAGNSKTMKRKADRCSRKKESQSHHSVSVPVSMTFICRPECVPAW